MQYVSLGSASAVSAGGTSVLTVGPFALPAGALLVVLASFNFTSDIAASVAFDGGTLVVLGEPGLSAGAENVNVYKFRATSLIAAGTVTATYADGAGPRLLEVGKVEEADEAAGEMVEFSGSTGFSQSFGPTTPGGNPVGIALAIHAAEVRPTVAAGSWSSGFAQAQRVGADGAVDGNSLTYEIATKEYSALAAMSTTVTAGTSVPRDGALLFVAKQSTVAPVPVRRTVWSGGRVSADRYLGKMSRVALGGSVSRVIWITTGENMYLNAANYATIQAAIDAAAAAGGGTVFFHPGTYLVGASSVIMKDNVRLLGCGRASILRDTNSLTILNLTGVDNFAIESLAFESSLAGSFVAGRGAMWADISSPGTNGLISACFINGVNTCGISGTFTDCKIISNDIRNTREHGIYLSGATDCVVLGNALNATGSIGSGAQCGIKLASSQRVMMSSNTITAPEHDGILFESGASDCAAIGNSIRNCPSRSIRFNAGSTKCAAIANVCVNATLQSIRLLGGDDHLVSNNMLDSGASIDQLITIDAGVTDAQILNNSCISTVATIISDAGTRTVLAGNKTNSTDGYYQIESDLNIGTGRALRVAGTQVVGPRGAAIADASGGATIDAESRAAINALLARVRAHGLIST